jgi:hypothetical protein
MKLTDLRDELNARAETTDDTPDLLSGVHAKITRTKRRRKTGALGAVAGVAVIAAFATGLIPGLTTSTPQPADDVPHDYVKNGMVLQAYDGKDRLEKGWIGDPGQNTLDFNWTPEVQNIRFAGLCNSINGLRTFTVQVNDFVLGTDDCRGDQDTPGLGIGAEANSALWLVAPVGKAAHVIVRLADDNGRPLKDSATQLAVGIYQTVAPASEGAPIQTPPTSADDYVKDGIRYRAKIGGDTLIGAKVADRGKSSFDFSFTAPGGTLRLSDFCTARTGYAQPEYWLRVEFNGAEVSSGSCSGDSIDAGLGSSFIPGDAPPPAGTQVKVTVRLEDVNGKPVTRPNDWIGLGVYAKGKQVVINKSTSLDEIREFGGHNYRLRDDVSHVPMANVRGLTIRTPPDTPFLISYGSTSDADQKITIRLSSRSNETGDQGGGIGTVGEAAGPVGKATVTVTGVTTKSTGELLLAIYLPAD